MPSWGSAVWLQRDQFAFLYQSRGQSTFLYQFVCEKKKLRIRGTCARNPHARFAGTNLSGPGGQAKTPEPENEPAQGSGSAPSLRSVLKLRPIPCKGTVPYLQNRYRLRTAIEREAGADQRRRASGSNGDTLALECRQEGGKGRERRVDVVGGEGESEGVEPGGKRTAAGARRGMLPLLRPRPNLRRRMTHGRKKTGRDGTFWRHSKRNLSLLTRRVSGEVG